MIFWKVLIVTVQTCQEKTRNAATNELGFQDNTEIKWCRQTRCLNIILINASINLKSKGFKIRKQTWENIWNKQGIIFAKNFIGLKQPSVKKYI